MMNRVEMNEEMMTQVNGGGFIDDMKEVVKETVKDPTIWKDAVEELIDNPVDSLEKAWVKFKSWL